MTTSTILTDDNAVETKENLSALCEELLWDCQVEDWELTDDEFKAVNDVLVAKTANDYEEICDVVANDFRIDKTTIRLISEGYYVATADGWYATAENALLALESIGTPVTSIEEAISKELAVWQSPFPLNVRYGYAHE